MITIENFLVTLSDFGYVYLIGCYIKTFRLSIKSGPLRVTK